MMKKRILVFATALMMCAVPATPSFAQSTNLSDFPLAKAAPADVFIAVMAKANPEREFLNKYWAEVWQAFEESGIMEDVWDLMTENVSDEDLDTIEETRERFGGLISNVDWGKLFEKEMIYTARMSSRLEQPSPYEGLLIGRMTGKLAEKNHGNFKELMQALADTITEQAGEQILIVGETKIEGVPMTTLGVAEAPHLICIGNRDDLLVISLFNRTLLQDALKLLRGKGDVEGLTQSDRFKSAIKKLPPAEDVIVFFNIGNMMRQVKDMIASAVPPPPVTTAPAGQQGYEQSIAPVRAIVKLLDDINIFDYMISVEWTDGYRVYSETYTKLDPSAKGKPLYKAFSGGSPVDDFAKYIPKETTDFWCGSGINFAELYRYAVNFIETNVPEGKGMIATFKNIQKEQWNLDIEKDILNLFEGNMQSITSGQNSVMMFKVTDEEKMNAQLDRLFNWIAEQTGEEAPLTVTEIKVADREGFRQVRQPMLMMMGGMMPVVGTADGYFFFATSDRFLAKCLNTAKGEHPNIMKNKRFKAEALPVKGGGPVDSISFADETRMGEELQAGIGMVSAALGFMNMAGGADFPPEMRDMLSTVSPLLAKLGVVLGKLDFYQSSSSYTISDGMAWHTYGVQNYKEPKPEKPASESEDGSSEEAAEEQEETTSL